MAGPSFTGGRKNDLRQNNRRLVSCTTVGGRGRREKWFWICFDLLLWIRHTDTPILLQMTVERFLLHPFIWRWSEITFIKSFFKFKTNFNSFSNGRLSINIWYNKSTNEFKRNYKKMDLNSILMLRPIDHALFQEWHISIFNRTCTLNSILI